MDAVMDKIRASENVDGAKAVGNAVYVKLKKHVERASGRESTIQRR